MKKILKSIKPETYLFIFSCFYLVLLGLLLSYNYHVTDNYNLLFDADTARVVQDATEVVAEHYRADVHPLFILIIQPIVHFISGIVHNKILAIINSPFAIFTISPVSISVIACPKRTKTFCFRFIKT